MENYEIIKNIDDFKNRFFELQKAADVEKIKSDLNENEKVMENPNFWNDQKTSAHILKQVKAQKEKLDTFSEIGNKIDDLEVFFEMYTEESEDIHDDIVALIEEISELLSEFEVKLLLSQSYDDNDAFVEMHPGAGGTESQDWCEMLFRMYKYYCDNMGYTMEIIDYQDGEEAGIKSVSFIVHGDKAYGYLRSEQGVHRLVRISPFDSNKRRHTSFVGIIITPVIDDEINHDVKPEDIRVDTYRSSGAGGQHVNTTDSAIRITHIKTGIVVTCQNERSQIQNREKAMQILKAKLYQLEMEEKDKKIREISGESAENSFGSQIRSYVFHPYSMVKDHRTNYEEFNTDSVMNGNINGFINAYLKSDYNKR